MTIQKLMLILALLVIVHGANDANADSAAKSSGVVSRTKRQQNSTGVHVGKQQRLPLRRRPPKRRLRMATRPDSPSIKDTSVTPTAHQVPAVDGSNMLEGQQVIMDDYHHLGGSPMTRRRTVAAPNAFIWGRAEYLQWWTRGTDAPAFATTSPTGTNQASAGVLGQPGTRVLFGDSELLDNSNSGGRYTLGMWFCPCRSKGLQVTYTGLENESENFSATNSDFSILARPFFNTESNADEAHFIAFPDQASGSLDVSLKSEFQTLEVLHRTSSHQACSRIDYLLGYRMANLDDRLRISESTRILALPDATVDLFDQFDVTNDFHGGEFGIAAYWQRNPCLSGELTAKVAVGQTRTRLNIAGETTTTNAGASANANGGLLAQSTNIGSFEDEELSAIAEFGFTLRRHFGSGLTATCGYTFLFWSDVARVGDQIDPVINTTQIPPGTLSGEPRPEVPFDITSFWAQGLRFGVEYRF